MVDCESGCDILKLEQWHVNIKPILNVQVEIFKANSNVERQESKNMYNNDLTHMYESIIFSRKVALEVGKMVKTRKKSQQ